MEALEQALQWLQQGRLAEGAARVAELVNQAVLAGQRVQAEGALRRALVFAPKSPPLLARLAALQKLGGHAAQAEVYARQALAGDPGEAIAAALLTDMLVDRGVCGEAIAVAQACLARQPHAAQVHRALSVAFAFQGRTHQAHVHAMSAARALGNNPTALSNALVTALYDDQLTPSQLHELHVALGNRFQPDPAQATLAPRPPRAGRRLRVGFLSADLRAHPVGFFIEPVLRHLDRAQHELFVYSRTAMPDALTTTLRHLDLQWRDVAALDDARTHALIQNDAIDVLIDLTAHTHGGRPRMLVARAAPIQALYVGYPYSSGLPNIDFLIADAHTVPPSSERWYRERIIRLPHAFLCLMPLRDAPPVGPAPALLHGGALTFGSFNHLAKLSDRTVALWSRVLNAVPGSRLMLCAIALVDPETRAFTHQRFAAHGIDAQRLILLPPKVPTSEFLAYYDNIDIGLDPLPFHGGTTTLQAMWQGVPVISLPGQLLHNRMGAALLREAGLDAFIARDETNYVEIAQHWSDRVAELARWRAGARAALQGTALIDGARFAAGFAQALAQMVAAKPS
jgi:predicted O-linked N-acetylglucosamine transferase (SPINDLY family)